MDRLGLAVLARSRETHTILCVLCRSRRCGIADRFFLGFEFSTNSMLQVLRDSLEIDLAAPKRFPSNRATPFFSDFLLRPSQEHEEPAKHRMELSQLANPFQQLTWKLAFGGFGKTICLFKKPPEL